jgi:hypothetical protein
MALETPVPRSIGRGFRGRMASPNLPRSVDYGGLPARGVASVQQPVAILPRERPPGGSREELSSTVIGEVCPLASYWPGGSRRAGRKAARGANRMIVKGGLCGQKGARTILLCGGTFNWTYPTLLRSKT